MFVPNKVKIIRTELSDIVTLLNDKDYTLAIACCKQIRIQTTLLIAEIQERSQANDKETRNTTRAETRPSEA